MLCLTSGIKQILKVKHKIVPGQAFLTELMIKAKSLWNN